VNTDEYLIATELCRPFVGVEMKNVDVAFIVFVTVLGLVATGYEAYEIAMETPCTEVRSDTQRANTMPCY
jgi:hypothetical protein